MVCLFSVTVPAGSHPAPKPLYSKMSPAAVLGVIFFRGGDLWSDDLCEEYIGDGMRFVLALM